MKRIALVLGLITLLNVSAQAGGGDIQIKLRLQEEKQQVDGFGVSQAGWAAELFQHQKRTEIMELLYGNDGLRLSILRGEVFPQSPADTINDWAKRAGQLWISRYARQQCGVDKLIFSAWSPPAYMKSNGKASQGFLKPEYYQAYADYLVAFCQSYQEAGLKVYALSPSNEPGYEAPWNSCRWSSDEMGRFLTGYLTPAFKKQCPDIKIIYGENPTWSTPQNVMLQSIASEKFVNEILDKYPEVSGDAYIASGHGYDIPLSQYFKDAQDIATPVIPYYKAMERGQRVWVTEISSVDPLDTTMTNGLKWAKSFHDYLTNADVNAYIWWGGAIPADNNESLIVLDRNGKDYRLTKRYETFGNYTRYIPVGSRRIVTHTEGLPEDVLVSAFRKDNHYCAVLINPTDKKVVCKFSPDRHRATGTLKIVTTTSQKKWYETGIALKSGSYTVEIEPQSVTTLVGELN